MRVTAKKHHFILGPLVLSLFLFSPLLRADYGWIPKYQNLQLRLGVDYFQTSSNYDIEGFDTPMNITGELTELSEVRFFIEPEYGFAEDWSFFSLIQITQANVNRLSTGEQILGTSGLADFFIGTKWRFKKELPLLTLESRVKIPTNGNTNLKASDLLLSDGNVDWHLILHSGFRMRPLFFSLSPGFKIRFGNFASALTFDGGVGGRMGKIYGLLSATTEFPLSEMVVFNSSKNVADAFGTGGSHRRLSENPMSIDFGMKVGYQLYKKTFIEAHFEKSIIGSKAPNYWKLGLNFFTSFDFYVEEKKTRVQELPLREDY